MEVNYFFATDLTVLDLCLFKIAQVLTVLAMRKATQNSDKRKAKS